MASSRCIACAMLGLSPVLRSASASNPGAVVARVQNFGSLRGAVSEGFQQRAWRSDSGSGRSSSRSAEFLFHRLEGGRGGWIMNSEPGQDLNLVTSRGQGFVVGANGRWWNSLFELGDDGGIEEGPIELPPRELDIDPLAFPEASPAQIVASVALTGAIAVLLVRSLRRRAQRAKEMQFRSSGVATKESVKEDARKAAIANLTKAPEVPVPPPSPGQTILGAAVAGAIALVLYKFTTTVEGNFSGKAISMNYSIRNLTITVRTIINGLLYLATFVFAANSIGLGLYSLQLLWGSDPLPDPSRAEPQEKLESSSDSAEKSSEADDTN
ncbi:hypothetical protein Mapa_015503 [Marchantia paleacea]|nr:hypothetical protein Mapa_015503 [Marchantia paleacea]